MKWIMSDHVHYDRVAACWVIERFIDQQAEFSFAPSSTPLSQLPQDATPLGFREGKLGMHDENGSCFMKVVREYHLEDPAFVLMGEVIAKGVDFVLHDYRPGPDDRYGQMGVGLASYADGMILVESDDRKRLDQSYITWDSLYALLSAGKQRVHPPAAH